MNNNNDDFTLSNLIVFIILTAINPLIGIIYMWIYYKIQDSPKLQSFSGNIYYYLGLIAAILTPLLSIVVIILYGYKTYLEEFAELKWAMIIETFLFMKIRLRKLGGYAAFLYTIISVSNSE